MLQEPSYEELEKQVAGLKKALQQRARFEEINRTLYKVSNTVSRTLVLNELFASIRSALSAIIDTTSFFIALYEPVRDSITFPFCVDTVDSSYPPSLNVCQTKSLTAEVIRTGRPLLITGEEDLRRRSITHRHISPPCTIAKIWLGVPLDSRRAYWCHGVPHIISITRDISERKQAEAERERLMVAIEQTRDIVVVTDPEGKIQYANPAFQTITGNSRAESLGHTMRIWLWSRSIRSSPPMTILQKIVEAANRSADIVRQRPRGLDLNDTLAGMLKMLRRASSMRTLALARSLQSICHATAEKSVKTSPIIRSRGSRVGERRSCWWRMNRQF